MLSINHRSRKKPFEFGLTYESRRLNLPSLYFTHRFPRYLFAHHFPELEVGVLSGPSEVEGEQPVGLVVRQDRLGPGSGFGLVWRVSDPFDRRSGNQHYREGARTARHFFYPEEYHPML